METLIYSGILFVSAFLLFWIQPFIAKVFLPILGGSPSVWQTCMVFFQGSMLAGYLYAHTLTRSVSLKLQIMFHALLIIGGLFFLPFATSAILAPKTDSNLIWWLLKSLGLIIFIPTFILCTSAPLLQRWFTHTRHHRAHDPYYLYAASNAGSLIALLAYPFFIEPMLGVQLQNTTWRLLYLVFFISLFYLLYRLWNDEYIHNNAQSKHRVTNVRYPDWLTKTRWILFAFVPSSLFIGLTTTITTDIASAPLFWVMPLALYISTYILCFSNRPLFPHNYVISNQAFLFIPLLISLPFTKTTAPITLIEAHMLAAFGCAMFCHGELYRLRPHKQYLTEFYIFIALGGLCGGLLNSIIAPNIFNSLIEYPLILALAYLLRSSDFKMTDLIVPAIMLLTVITTNTFTLQLLSWSPSHYNLILRIIYFFIFVIAFAKFNRPVTFALAILLLFYANETLYHNLSSTTYQIRNFFGVIKITENSLTQTRFLLHGTTMHGAQSLAEKPHRELTYYMPVLDLLKIIKQPDRASHIAMIGMGTGTTACIAPPPNNEMTFYEIDPDIIAIARNPKYFTYLNDCPPAGGIHLGDGRIEIQKAKPHYYDLIMLDAFSSDAIPTHLINLEATQIYLDKSTPSSLIAFHISNRYVNLMPVLARIALHLNLYIYTIDSTPAKSDKISSNFSRWVVLSTDNHLAHQLTQYKWKQLDPKKYARSPLWTDDFSNILSVLK